MTTHPLPFAHTASCCFALALGLLLLAGLYSRPRHGGERSRLLGLSHARAFGEYLPCLELAGSHQGLCAFPEELALCWGPLSRARPLGLAGRRAFCLRAPALAISPPSGVPKLPRDAACVGFPSVQTCPPSRFPARAQTPVLEALSPFLPLPFALAHSEDADWPFGKYGVFLPASPSCPAGAAPHAEGELLM